MNKQRTQLLEAIMSEMSELHRCFATNRDTFLATFKLSRPQMELLFSLKKGPLSTGVLAKQFSVSSSAISQMVDQLERKGLVLRVQSEDDRRVTKVQLAEDATEQFKKLRRELTDHISSKFADVSNSEFAQLLKILTKITTNIGS